ncbi:MAG: PKD domain-containing protein [Bacteroidetes bacterium]|nr:PKD domain-containing protein [Bacteroidota bacterium]
MKRIYKFLLAIIMVAATAAGSQVKAQTNYNGFEFSAKCLTVSLWATDKRAYDSCAMVKYTLNNTYVMGAKASYTFPSAGTYTVCMKILDTCKKWDTSVCKTITVKNCCNWSGIGFSYSNKCRAYTFEGNNSNGCLKYQFYTMVNGSVVTLKAGRVATYTYSTSGSYYVKMVVQDTCNKCDTAIYQYVKVDCNPCSLNPEFTFKYDCFKYKFVATNTISGATYYWSFGDGSTGSGVDATHTYLKNGVYKICLVMKWKDPHTGDECKKEVCKEIKVSCGSGCDLKGDFKYTTSGGYAKFYAYSNTGYYYEWSFGDGTYGVGKDPYHQYKKPGTYTVCVKIYDKSKKCSIKICKTIVIEEPCSVRATFTWLEGSGGNVKFGALSYGGYKYVWDYGDGSTGSGQYSDHTYSKPGTYKVCLTVYSKSGKCKTTICKSVKVGGGTSSRCNWAAKGAGWGYSIVCPKLYLEAKNLDNGSNCIKYYWGITPANTNQTTYFTGRVQGITFSSNGTYNVCLKLVDSCHKCDTVICKTITINCNDKCNLPGGWTQSNKCRDFTFSGNSVIDKNGTTYSNPCHKYSWSFGDGTYGSGKYVTHSYAKTGIYKVCMKVIDTCLKCDTIICREIKVECADSSKCDWSWAKLYSSISCNVVGLGVSAPSSNAGCYKYTYTLGNTSGSTSDNRYAKYTFTTKGTYTICVKIQDTCHNCDTVLCTSVTISCLPTKCDWSKAGFGSSNKCRDYTFEANNLYNGCVKYSWSIAGTLAGTGRLMTHSFSKTGTYYVCLKMIDTCNKCDTVICQYIKVDCNPCSATAKFTIDSVSKSGVVYLTNGSTGGYYYVWDFGDSTYSYLQNPGKHAYSNSSTRKICLTVYDSLKTCSTTYCVTVQIVKSRNSASVANVNVMPNVSIFPNPASDYFNISVAGMKAEYEVLNLQGQVIQNGTVQNETTVSTQSWAEGIYLIKTRANGTQNTTRLVVVRQ